MNPTAWTVRCRVYQLLITVAIAAAIGRILAVNLVFEPYLHRNESDPADGRRIWPAQRPKPMPTFSSNDRSRWATVRALVDEGTYVVGRRVTNPDTKTYRDEGIVFEDGWQTVDKILHPETHEFYSSKPPLLPTLVAGEYWLLKHLFGWSLAEQPFAVVLVILLTINALPLFVYLWLLSLLVEHLGTTDWGRLYVLAAGCFGTLVTPFLITFNNHTIAACAVMVALYAAVRIWYLGDRSAVQFALAGFFAGFAVTNELPALAFAALLFALLVRADVWRTLLCFAPAAALPVVALVATNYAALGDWRPAYEKFGTAYYEYEGSHWKRAPGQQKRGIDWAWQKEDRGTYAFHVLLGHHGLFSLSPIFLLALARMLALKRSFGGGAEAPKPAGLLAGLTLALTVVVLAFYIFFVDERTRNYGGWSCGPRWLLWLTPLWLVTMLPVVDWLSERRWGRLVAYTCLAVSVLSASYPAWNPWRMPWLYRWMEAQGWIQY